MRRSALSTQVFLAIWGVSLGTAVVVGLFARRSFSAAFDRYLASMPMPGAGRRAGHMLGVAEQAFLGSIDEGVVLAAGVALAAATLIALVLAAYLSRPLKRLDAAARELGEGDLSQRVDPEGPLEVAALGDSFNRMADSLELAEELRRRLVADVAHELRNPLAAARAQAESIVDGVADATLERVASVVEDLQHLSLLVDDLQELAAAESGGIRYRMDEVDLSDLVRREAMRARTTARPGVEVRTDTADAVVVIADERRLSQVLRNLLSNSSRHTVHGSITISISCADDGAVVAVSDTGEGISDSDVAHIFERFYRADSARTSDTGGAGVGLAISRAIIRDHGGEMFASSRPGEGAIVGFRIPFRP